MIILLPATIHHGFYSKTHLGNMEIETSIYDDGRFCTRTCNVLPDSGSRDRNNGCAYFTTAEEVAEAMIEKIRSGQ